MNDTLPSNDKRLFSRVGHVMPVVVTQEKDKQQAFAVDFSESGARLTLAHSVDVGQPIRLCLMLPGDEIGHPEHLISLDLKARIAWQKNDSGQLRCGAEFIGLTPAQRSRLRSAFGFAKKILAVSVAGFLFQSGHAIAETASPAAWSMTGGSAMVVSSEILAGQTAVNSISNSLQANLGRALQDVLNLKKNTAGKNNPALALMYQASLASNVAKLSVDGVNLVSATERLNKLVVPVISLNSETLRIATRQHEEAQRSGNASAIAASEAAMNNAAAKANNYVKAVYGELVPSATEKIQGGITNLVNGAMKLGTSLFSKDTVAIEAAKAAVTADLDVLMADYAAMTQASAQSEQAAPSTQSKTEIAAVAKPIVQEIVKSVSQSSMLSSFLSSLIKSPAAKIAASSVPKMNGASPTKVKLMDGSELAYVDKPIVHSVDTLGLSGGALDASQNKRAGYVMLTDKAGTTMAAGYGESVQYAYARALHGSDDLAAMSSEMSVANLSGVARGGGLFAYGAKLTDDTRFAISWSTTDGSTEDAAPFFGMAGTQAMASSLDVGLSHRFNEQVGAGVSVELLKENHGILGNTYDPGSAFSFGEKNRTINVGLSADLQLSKSNSLLMEAGFATTKGGQASGLIANISDIESRSYGMTFLSKSVLNKEDRLAVSMVKPLRVVSGAVALATGVDRQAVEWISLAPTGSETDYQLSYDTPLKNQQSLSIQASMRKDVQNIANNNDASVGVSWSMKF